MTFGKHDADNDSQRSGNCPKCDCPMHWTANMGLVNHETDSLACKDNQIERLRRQLAAVTGQRDRAVEACRRLCKYNNGWIGGDPQLYRIRDAAKEVVVEADTGLCRRMH